MRRNGGSLLVLVLVIATAVAGVSAPPAGAASGAHLSSKTLSLSEMPPGWSVYHTRSSSLNNLGGCLRDIEAQKRLPKGIERAVVNYRDGQSPILGEILEAGKGAAARYDKFLSILNGCTNVSFTVKGKAVTGTIGVMALPTLGDSSRAYSMSFSVEGFSIGVDLVFFRIGQYDGELEYLDLFPNASTVQAFATEAVNKIEGRPVIPPATKTTQPTFSVPA